MTEKEAQNNLQMIDLPSQIKTIEEFNKAVGMSSINSNSLEVSMGIGIVFQLVFGASMQYIWTILAML